MTKASVKKTLGIVGSGILYLIAMYGAYKTPSQIPVILGIVEGYLILLFGLKKWSGNIGGQNVGQNQDMDKKE